MSVSSRVALYATIPALAILLYGIIAILVYPTSIDARVSIFSSIATAVTVLFLISERLRESARQKLDFTNKKALTPAFEVGRNGIGSAIESQGIVLQRCKDLLQHNGRYLRVKLYPANFLNTLDRAKSAIFAYDKLHQDLLKTGYKEFGQNRFDDTAFLVALELLGKGDYPETKIADAQVMLEDLKKKEPDSVESFRHAGAAVASDLGQVTTQLEKFFTKNQLEHEADRKTPAQ